MVESTTKPSLFEAPLSDMGGTKCWDDESREGILVKRVWVVPLDS